MGACRIDWACVAGVSSGHSQARQHVANSSRVLHLGLCIWHSWAVSTSRKAEGWSNIPPEIDQQWSSREWPKYLDERSKPSTRSGYTETQSKNSGSQGRSELVGRRRCLHADRNRRETIIACQSHGMILRRCNRNDQVRETNTPCA